MEEILRKNKYESVSLDKKGDLITIEIDWDSGSEYSCGTIELTESEVRIVIKQLELLIE